MAAPCTSSAPFAEGEGGCGRRYLHRGKQRRGEACRTVSRLPACLPALLPAASCCCSRPCCSPAAAAVVAAGVAAAVRGAAAIDAACCCACRCQLPACAAGLQLCVDWSSIKLLTLPAPLVCCPLLSPYVVLPLPPSCGTAPAPQHGTAGVTLTPQSSTWRRRSTCRCPRGMCTRRKKWCRWVAGRQGRGCGACWQYIGSCRAGLLACWPAG
jgi:hypothetical protein